MSSNNIEITPVGAFRSLTQEEVRSLNDIFATTFILDSSAWNSNIYSLGIDRGTSNLHNIVLSNITVEVPEIIPAFALTST